MKTSVNIAMIILLFTLFNCSNPDIETVQPEIEFYKQIKFFTIVSIWNQPTVINHEYANEKERTHYVATGLSYAKKLTKYELEMSHIASQLIYGESIRIEDGKFEILGEEGDSIFGTYEGYGDPSQKTLSLGLLLSITGGTGFYENASGYFEMKTKVYEPHSSSLLFEVRGYIIRDI